MQDARITPSVVYIDDDQVVVGSGARDQSIAFPDKVVSLVKRQMGTPNKVKANGRDYTAETVSGFILKKLKEDAERVLGGPITEAVITVPAYFGLAERKATEDAGLIAGLKARHIINEPTAAAIAFGAANAADPRTLLVYDLGGGTFDITLLRVKPTGRKIPDIEVVSSGGDRRLGGADWDKLMADHVLKTFREAHGADPGGDPSVMRDLLLKCERTKIALATGVASTVVCTFGGKTTKVAFDRPLLLDLTRHLLDRTMNMLTDLLAEKSVREDQIDEVLLVGGSTKLVMVRDALAAKFGKERINSSVHPDLCVAEGAAWYGHLLAQGELPPEPGQPADGLSPGRSTGGGLGVQFTDVCPFALGVAIMMSRDSDELTIDTLIAKDTKLPCDETGQYFTRHDGQTAVDLDVYENRSRKKGEKTDPELSRKIAAVVLDGLPGGRPAGQPIRVTFRLDAAVRLRVTGVDVSTGRTVEADIDYASAMSAEEREAARKEVSKAIVQS